MATTNFPDVIPGAEVVTSDGASLGMVADVADASFKVDVRMQPDYWLGRAYVIGTSEQRVEMSFTKSDLKAYKLPHPGATAAADPAQEALADNVLPEDEQIAQRRRMEEQLARQRRDLPRDDDAGG
ncbi:MAG: hypothetical protein WEB52_08995 [Dehalococcoidia bacterium]